MPRQHAAMPVAPDVTATRNVAASQLRQLLRPSLLLRRPWQSKAAKLQARK